MSYTPPLDAEVTAFVTTALLANGATFDSGVLDAGGKTQVQTEISASHDGTIDISFCADAGGTDVVRSLSIPYVAADGYQFFAAPAFVNFIKYEFTNTGGVTQTDFYYTTKFLTTALSPQLLTTNAFIAPAMVASLTRSISVGQDPNDVFTNTPHGGISNINSTDVPLIANDTYDGTFTDTSGYASTSIFVKADQDSAAGGLKIIHSSDGVTDERVISFTYLTAANPQGLVYMIPASTKYFRIQYVNGVTPNGVGGLIISIKNETSPQQTIALPVNLPIQAGTLSNVTKSVIVGKNDAGNYDNVPVDNQNHLEVNVSNPKTAYDELVVGNLSPVSQITFPYNINPDIVTKVVTAGGTAVQGNNMAVLNTSATLSSSCSLTSIKQIPYRAGLGHIARFACVFAGVPTVSLAYSGIGVGDAADGYGFLLGLGGFGISYRTNTAPTFIAQTAWNIDVLDGSGSLNNPSGMNLDINTGNSYQIAYGSGFGTVNFSVESDVSGDYVLVHTLALANTLTAPSVYNPTFPMRAEADNGNANDNLTISVASMSSFIEGKNSIEYSPGVINSQSGVEAYTGTDELEIITFFNKADVFGGTANNKVYCKILGISWLNELNKTAQVRLREEATGMAAGTFTDIGTNTSVVSYRTDGTGAVTGGKILFTAFAEKDGKGGIFVDLTDLNLTMTPGKKYTITAQNLGVAANANQFGTLLWTEDF